MSDSLSLPNYIKLLADNLDFDEFKLLSHDQKLKHLMEKLIFKYKIIIQPQNMFLGIRLGNNSRFKFSEISLNNDQLRKISDNYEIDHHHNEFHPLNTLLRRIIRDCIKTEELNNPSSKQKN